MTRPRYRYPCYSLACMLRPPAKHDSRGVESPCHANTARSPIFFSKLYIKKIVAILVAPPLRKIRAVPQRDWGKDKERKNCAKGENEALDISASSFTLPPTPGSCPFEMSDAEENVSA